MENESEKRQHAIYWLALVGAVASLVLVFVICILEMYIRWKINQNFTLLGVGELPALAFIGTALSLGIMYWYRPRA